MLLCGPTDAWPADPAVPRAGPVTVHRLTPDDDAGVLHDRDGVAARRLGLSPGQAAQLLVRPDGHIGYRAGGTDLAGLRRYVTNRLLPGPGRRLGAGPFTG